MKRPSGDKVSPAPFPAELDEEKRAKPKRPENVIPGPSVTRFLTYFSKAFVNSSYFDF